MPQFHWVNTVLVNLKTAISGAHKAFNFCKYAGRYLGAFSYRFNRRFNLHALVTQLFAHALHSLPERERDIRGVVELLPNQVRALKTGKSQKNARISFETPELLWKVLTARRWELLKSLCAVGPVSIRGAARRVGRDVKAVHTDVTALLDAGVLDRTASGAIEFPYQAVKVELLRQAARGPTPPTALER